MADEVHIVFCTCSPERAPELAGALVERRVAACVNLVPAVRSVYRWNDAVQDDTETLLLIKSPVARFDALRAAILELHPYELPEIVAVKLDAGHPAYLGWVLSSC